MEIKDQNKKNEIQITGDFNKWLNNLFEYIAFQYEVPVELFYRYYTDEKTPVACA